MQYGYTNGGKYDGIYRYGALQERYAVKKWHRTADVSLRAHNVAQFFEVAGDCEIAVVAITSLHVFVDSMNVDGDTVQKLRLNVTTQRYSSPSTHASKSTTAATNITLRL